MFSVRLRPIHALLFACFSLPLFGLVSTSFGQQGKSDQAEATKQERTIDFEADVVPIFQRDCLRCHGEEKQEEGFRIDKKTGVRDYLEVGDATFSDLFYVISTDEKDDMMPPPEEGGPMAKEDIETIRLWINQGAEWPKDYVVQPMTEGEQAVAEAELTEKKDAKDDQDSSWTLLWGIIGLLHPVLLHFPVALIVGGAVFALFGFRGESPLSDAAYYCLWLGALIGILACVSGWSFAIYKGVGNDWQSYDIWNKSIDMHRWGGIVVSILALVLALIASSSRRKDPYGTGAFWKLSLILLAFMTGYVAHHGGKMTHDGLHDNLERKSIKLYKRIVGQSEADRMKLQEEQDQKERAEKEAKENEAKEGAADTKQVGDGDDSKAGVEKSGKAVPAEDDGKNASPGSGG